MKVEISETIKNILDLPTLDKLVSDRIKGKFDHINKTVRFNEKNEGLDQNIDVFTILMPDWNVVDMKTHVKNKYGKSYSNMIVDLFYYKLGETVIVYLPIESKLN